MKAAAPPDWYLRFFDSVYLGILKANERTDNTRKQVDFAERVLRLRPGARILDVGCGYGRHAAVLARRGHEVVGIDLSGTMIAEARRRWRRRLRLEFVRADMRRITYKAEFDAAVNFFTTFGYFSDRENRGVLARLVRAVRPGGRILIDHRDPAHDWRAFGRENEIRTWWRAGPGRFVLEHARSDPDRGLIDSTWELLRPGKRRGWRRSFRVRLYTVREWRGLLRSAGARLVSVHSGYGTPYRQGKGPRLIVVAERPG